MLHFMSSHLYRLDAAAATAAVAQTMTVERRYSVERSPAHLQLDRWIIDELTLTPNAFLLPRSETTRSQLEMLHPVRKLRRHLRRCVCVWASVYVYIAAVLRFLELMDECAIWSNGAKLILLLSEPLQWLTSVARGYMSDRSWVRSRSSIFETQRRSVR